MEDYADRGVRRLRASVDTRDQEPAKLSFQEMSLDSLGQRRRGRQDAGSADQDGTQPQDRD